MFYAPQDAKNIQKGDKMIERRDYKFTMAKKLTSGRMHDRRQIQRYN